MPPLLPVKVGNVKTFTLLTNNPCDVALAQTPPVLVELKVVMVKAPDPTLPQLKVTTLEEYEAGEQPGWLNW